MRTTLFEFLRVTNRMIRGFLQELKDTPENPRDLAPICQYINFLCLRIDEVGNKLQAEHLPPPSDVEFYRVRADYADNLEQLRQAMDGIHQLLVTRREELETERTRLQTLDRWAATARFTDPAAPRKSTLQVTIRD